jgi:hypothetical protein
MNTSDTLIRTTPSPPPAPIVKLLSKIGAMTSMQALGKVVDG